MASVSCRVLSWRLDVCEQRAWIRATARSLPESPGCCQVVVEPERRSRLPQDLAAVVERQNTLRVASAFMDGEDEGVCRVFLILEGAGPKALILQCKRVEAMAALLAGIGAPVPDQGAADALLREVGAWRASISDLDCARASEGNIVNVCPLAQPVVELQGSLIWTQAGADGLPVRKHFAVAASHLYVFGRDASGAPEWGLPLDAVIADLADDVEQTGVYSWRLETPARSWTLAVPHGTAAMQWLEALAAGGAETAEARAQLERARAAAVAETRTLDDIFAREDIRAAFHRFGQEDGKMDALDLLVQMRDAEEADWDGLADQCSQADLDGFLRIFEPHCEAWQALVDDGEPGRVVELALGILRHDLESDLVPRFLESFHFTSLRDAAESALERRAELIFGDKVLHITNEGGERKRAPLRQHGRVLVGRDEACDVVLACPRASRFHCILHIGKDDIIKVYDLGSSHGSWVNGTRIEAAGLRARDRLEVGSVRLSVGPDL